MDPGLLWAIIVGTVVLLIIYGMASSRLQQRKLRRLRQKAMPVVSQSVRAGVQYNVFLSNGSTFQEVKVVGLTAAPAGQFVGFPLESWLVLERIDGKRVFIKPTAVRFFEEL